MQQRPAPSGFRNWVLIFFVAFVGLLLAPASNPASAQEGTPMRVSIVLGSSHSNNRNISSSNLFQGWCWQYKSDLGWSQTKDKNGSLLPFLTSAADGTLSANCSVTLPGWFSNLYGSENRTSKITGRIDFRTGDVSFRLELSSDDSWTHDNNQAAGHKQVIVQAQGKLVKGNAQAAGTATYTHSCSYTYKVGSPGMGNGAAEMYCGRGGTETGTFTAGKVTLEDTGTVDWSMDLEPTAPPAVKATAPNPTPTPTSTPQPDIDLSIDHVEVTQAIQDADNSVPLVANRTTLVRVFLKVTGHPTGPVAGVTIDACGMGSSFRGMTDKCVPAANKNTPFTAPLNPQRANIGDTLNLFLPNAMTYSSEGLTQGASYPLELWINPNKTIPESNYNNNRFSIQLTFTPINRLRIGYLKIGYQPPGQAAATYPSNNINTYAQVTQKLYPLPDNGLDYAEIPVRRPYRKPLFDPTDPLTKTFALEDQFVVTLRKAYDLFSGDKPDQLVAWLPTIPNPVPAGVGVTTGQSDPMWFTYDDKTKGAGRVTFAKDYTPLDALYRQDVLAHEMAHNFGLRHTNQADACGAWDSNTEWPYKNSRIQKFGFDTLTRALIPNTRFDMMSYCMTPGSNIWISPFSYTQLYNSYLRPRAETTRQIAFLGRGAALRLSDALVQARPEQLVVSGAIRRDGSAGRLDPAYHSADLDPGDLLPTSGHSCLRLTGASGTLATYCFTLPFRAHQSNALLDEEAFTLKVPYAAGTTRVALVSDNKELAALSASPNAPTLSITSPRAGETWTGAQTLAWSSADADGGKLTYTVLYTPNGGQSWYPLEIDTPDPQLAIQTSEIASGDHVQFRVLASDGLNTTKADSPPVQVRDGIAPFSTPGAAGGDRTATPGNAGMLLPVVLGGTAVCGLSGIVLVAGLIVLRRPRARRPAPPSIPRPADLPEQAPAGSWSCSRCGQSNQASSRFCQRCGAPLKPANLPR